MNADNSQKGFKMPDLQQFVPFLAFFKDLCSFFKDLPWGYQVGYGVFLIIFILYTGWCVNLKYPFTFEIKNAQNNQLLQQEITVILDNNRKQEPFDITGGKITRQLSQGEYNISVKPDPLYKLVEPEKIKVNKDSNKAFIYVNITKALTNREDQETKEIEPVAPKVVQKDSQTMTLYTLIEKIGDNMNKPLEGLTIGNFSVVEQFNDTENPAEIVSLKSLNSSSLNIILALDVSGSMSNNIEEVKKAVRNFIETMQSIPSLDKSSGKIAIMLIFGESEKEIKFLTSHGNPMWFNFDQENFADVINQITLINTQGNTPLYDGIKLASERLHELDENAYNVVICLSDGEVNRGSNDEDRLIQLLKEKQTPVFSIIYRENNQESVLSQKMKYISSESGAGGENIGSFVNVDASKLNNLFVKIANSIGKAYELSWKSTGANIGDSVNVIIEVNYQAASEERLQAEIRKSYTLKDIPERKKVE